ncbi:MAG TPA: HD domain-containing protein [Candidatus Limnocylindria bacterium]|nr:HD domain-containing protein [Candidatus Limnocylindria bacterium]
MAVFALRRLKPPHVALLRAAAAAAGPSAGPVLVGGAVRDAWLGRPAVDLDLAVPSGALTLAARMAERVRGTCVVLDAERGSARVIAGALVLDITDFRAPSLEADLALRDFTVNALAVEVRALLADGRARIVDPTGGLADLEARRLRPPSPRVLDDDPLRALRAVRFEATLGLRLTPAAVRAVRAMAPALAHVSAERVRDEVVSLLDLPHTARALRRADGLGLLTVVFPEAEPMRATTQPRPHRFDVLEHSLRAVAGCDRLVARPDGLAPFGDEVAVHLATPLGGQVDRRRALKLAALLHDVSKPETRRRIGGRVRFFEHDVLGARRARAIGERLRLPERVSALLERLVRHHLRPMHLAQAGGITRRARYRFYRDLAEDTRDLLLLVLADSAAVTGVSPFAVWRHSTIVRDLLGGLAVEEQQAAAPPLLRGEDVMARYGLAPGPEVGRLLARAREAQGLGLVATREEALSFLDSPRDDP